MMKKKEMSELTVLASTALLLFLILFLSTALIATAQSDSSTIYAYATTEYDNTVSIINTVTNTVEAKINVGVDPYGVAVNPTGTKVYVANAASNNVSIIDTTTRTVISTLNVGVKPWGVAVNSDGTKVYVANIYSSSVSVIDTNTNTVTATVNVGDYPYGVAVNPTGTKVYVTNLDNSGSVDIIDTTTNTVIGNVNVGQGPEGVAFNPEGTKAYVANSFSNNVSVIDTDTNSVTATIDVGEGPYGIAVTPDGTKVYVTNRGNGNASTVSVIDTSTNTIVATVNVGTYPFGVAVTPDGTKVYVVNGGGMSVIDTTTNTVIATIEISGGSSAFGQFIGPAPVQDSTPLPVADVNIDESSSSGGSSHSSSGGGGTGGSPEPQSNVESKDTTKVFIPNEKPVFFNFTNDVTVVESISFESKKTMGKTTAIVENLKNKSALVSELPKDIIVYKYFNVWVGNAGYGYSENIRNASIYFKVNNTWIQARDINQSSIVLNKYDKENKEWTKCPVTLASGDKDCMYFTANIPGFYSFAITGAQKSDFCEIRNETIIEDATSTETVTDQEQPNPKKKLLPFIIVVIVGIVLVFKKKIRNNEQLDYYETIKSGISSVFGWIVEKRKYIIGKIKNTLKDPEVSAVIKGLIITVIGGLIVTVIGGIIVLVVQNKYFS